MTESEVIKLLKDASRMREIVAVLPKSDFGKCVIQALEKQIPKKPFYISETDENNNADVECPICHHDSDYSIYSITRGHCWKCGQLLDWSDEKE